jgi:hypothetical protein
MKKPSKSKIINSMKENMIFQLTYFAPYVKKMNIFSNSALIICTDIKDDTFNIVTNTHFSTKNANKKIDEIIKLLKKKKLPFSWWIGPFDTPSNLKELLISKKFIFKENDYGMYLNLKNYSPQKCFLKVKQVSNKKELKLFDEIHVKSGGNKNAFETIFKKIPQNAYKGNKPFRMYLSYKNDKPVTTGVLVLHAGVAGIYYIVTDPKERRKGFASNMMKFLLNEAKNLKMEIVVLQASESGKKVYEKMGFKKCCLFQEFALKNP